jgi:hypothetical protein
VLLSLTDKVTIFLHPEYIAAVKHAGLWSKNIIHKDVIAIEKTEGVAEEHGVIDALRMLLKKPEWNNCSTQVVLSGDFTKFRVVKWNDNLTQDEKKMRVLHEFEEIYGANGNALHVFISDSGFRKNSLAFAMDESLYKAILSLENEGILKLNSILPYFVLIANYWRKSINKSAWLIIKENKRIYTAMFRGNSWELIKLETTSHGLVESVKKMLAREMMHMDETMNIDQFYFHEERQSGISLESIKSIHQNMMVLGRNAFKEPNNKLMFSSYLI